jgi:hypothetical protein
MLTLERSLKVTQVLPPHPGGPGPTNPSDPDPVVPEPTIIPEPSPDPTMPEPNPGRPPLVPQVPNPDSDR